MPVEADRKTHMLRVRNPDDPGTSDDPNSGTFVDVKIIDEISFIDPHEQNQEYRWRISNTEFSTRTTHKVTVVNVDDTVDPPAVDTSQHVDVERVDIFPYVDPHDQGWETRINFLGNQGGGVDDVPEGEAPPKPKHLKTHEFTITNPDTGASIVMQRIDQFNYIDPHEQNWEKTYTLTWKDDDVDNPSEVDTSHDATTDANGNPVNPPWRFDPFQNPVSVTWGGDTEFAFAPPPPPGPPPPPPPPGPPPPNPNSWGTLQQKIGSIGADSSKFTLSMFFRPMLLPVIPTDIPALFRGFGIFNAGKLGPSDGVYTRFSAVNGISILYFHIPDEFGGPFMEIDINSRFAGFDPDDFTTAVGSPPDASWSGYGSVFCVGVGGGISAFGGPEVVKAIQQGQWIHLMLAFDGSAPSVLDFGPSPGFWKSGPICKTRVSGINVDIFNNTEPSGIVLDRAPNGARSTYWGTPGADPNGSPLLEFSVTCAEGGPSDYNILTAPPITLPFSGGHIGIPQDIALQDYSGTDRDFAVAYAAVQLWTDQLIDPDVHLDKFMLPDPDVPGGMMVVPPSVAEAAFGKPQFLFDGAPGAFKQNKGSVTTVLSTGDGLIKSFVPKLKRAPPPPT